MRTVLCHQIKRNAIPTYAGRVIKMLYDRNVGFVHTHTERLIGKKPSSKVSDTHLWGTSAIVSFETLIFSVRYVNNDHFEVMSIQIRERPLWWLCLLSI
ncbi:MAG: hypothetical protein MJK12_01055 [Colwellia sp.]|nr:hypothetical protein [Colwellia sp.]